MLITVRAQRVKHAEGGGGGGGGLLLLTSQNMK